MKTLCGLLNMCMGQRLVTAGLMEDHGGDHTIPKGVRALIDPSDLHLEPWFNKQTDFDPEMLLNRAAYFLGFASRLMTPDEAASCLDVNVQTVRQWLENGRLRSYRITSPNRQIDPDDVAALGGNVTQYRKLKRDDDDNTQREEAREEARRAMREVGINTDKDIAERCRALAILERRDRPKAERAGPVYAVKKQRPGWTWVSDVAARYHESGCTQYVGYFHPLRCWGWGWDWDDLREERRAGYSTSIEAMKAAECARDAPFHLRQAAS